MHIFIRTVHRYNHLKRAHWEVIIESLSTMTRIKSLNGLDSECIAALIAGKQSELDLKNKNLKELELVDPVVLLLSRSKDTLTQLDLRSHLLRQCGKCT